MVTYVQMCEENSARLKDWLRESSIPLAKNVEYSLYRSSLPLLECLQKVPFHRFFRPQDPRISSKCKPVVGSSRM